MRGFENKRAHASNGEELSDMFIGEDGILSVFIEENECEVVGFASTIFSHVTLVNHK